MMRPRPCCVVVATRESHKRVPCVGQVLARAWRVRLCVVARVCDSAALVCLFHRTASRKRCAMLRSSRRCVVAAFRESHSRARLRACQAVVCARRA
eukprot:2028726-Lingulodinium_polyedra.AAC.1